MAGSLGATLGLGRSVGRTLADAWARGQIRSGRTALGNARNIAFWVVLFLLILALFNLFSGSGNTLQSREISYSEFVSRSKTARQQVTLDGENRCASAAADGQDYVTIKPEDAELTTC
jgi:cell division protease FtsH